MRVEETDSSDTYKVSGRGELHLSILIEQMRRQGYEFQVSRPTVIYKKDKDGKVLEPMELLMIEVPDNYAVSYKHLDVYKRQVPTGDQDPQGANCPGRSRPVPAKSSPWPGSRPRWSRPGP